MKEYLKPAEIGEILGVSVFTVLRMCRTRALPAVKIAGSQWRIKESEFRKWEQEKMKS